MKSDSDRILTLQLTASAPFLPVAIRCVEETAGVFGLGREESLKLVLATEEIFSYLSNRICRGQKLDIHCINGISYVRVSFHFSVSVLDMGALNIISSVHGEDDLEEVGLMIASRSVDRLTIVAENNQRICLTIEKVKKYPAVSETIPAPAPAVGAITTERPDREGLKGFVTRVAQGPPDPLRPAFLNYPGRVADMVASGNCQAITAVDAKGKIAGGILFRYLTSRIMEIFGPHVFHQERAGEIAEMLLSDCIAKTVRTKVIGLVNLSGIPPLSTGLIEKQFEFLGSLNYCQDNGKTFNRRTYYRLLHEDPGCLIFTDSILKDFLQREYGRLFLAREIREIKDMGETKTGASIFSAEINRQRSEAILRPLWPGADLDANVDRHLRFLKAESLNNILFELDLGVSWQASLMPILVNRQFVPKLIIPFAGRADLLYFQYDGT